MDKLERVDVLARARVLVRVATKQTGDQVGDFLESNEELAAEAHTEAAEASREGTPRVPFETGLVITEDQEARMIAHAISRRTQLIDELGRDSSNEGTDSDGAAAVHQGDSFMHKREVFDLVYANKMDWRKTALGGIFAESNLTAPVSRRIVRQMSARAIDYFFSTDPWFAATPEGVDDADRADKLDRYSRFKLERSMTKEELSKAIELAFVRGEAVVKTTHVSKESIYRQWATVLVDEDGKFILDANGDYIFEGDAWISPMVDDGMGGMIPDEGATRILKKDGVTEEPETPIYVRDLVTRKITHFRGAKPGVVYYKDFLCPLTAESLQWADIVCHDYEAPLMSVADYFQRKDLFYNKPDDTLEAMRDSVEIVKEMGAGSSRPKSERNQPREEMGENTTDTGEQDPTALFAECWMRYDADGDGIQEEIFMLLDVANEKAVFYDYTANVTWDGERPFEVVRINPVDGRWYGLGAMEMFQSSQEFIDLQLNRINFAQSGSGRVTFWNPSATIEGQNNPHLKLNNGSTYTLAPNMKAEDALQYVTLPEVKAGDLKFLLEFKMQLMQLESGVVHAGDQQFAGMESAKLATGIRNIEKSGQEMFGIFLSQLEPGLQLVLDDVLGITVANLDKKEVFEYLEGDTRALDEITPEEVKNLKLNVRLLLTRYRGEQQLQSNMQAAALVKEFYTLLPEVQQRVAPFYRQMLKALQVKDADTVIMPLPLVAPGAGGVPADAAAGVQAINAKPPGQSAPNI